ncbi:uncharacterized protein L199_000783 [Kwoniella botswanensis]|uniref:uncharacterized protein n=1 Tax=Kwoniella botswanensis TaxID=1268659 RepID=UPI00315CB666
MSDDGSDGSDESSSRPSSSRSRSRSRSGSGRSSSSSGKSRRSAGSSRGSDGGSGPSSKKSKSRSIDASSQLTKAETYLKTITDESIQCTDFDTAVSAVRTLTDMSTFCEALKEKWMKQIKELRQKEDRTKSEHEKTVESLINPSTAPASDTVSTASTDLPSEGKTVGTASAESAKADEGMKSEGEKEESKVGEKKDDGGEKKEEAKKGEGGEKKEEEKK